MTFNKVINVALRTHQERAFQVQEWCFFIGNRPRLNCCFSRPKYGGITAVYYYHPYHQYRYTASADLHLK